MKPKVVTKPRPVSIPSSPATRELSTTEQATCWVDEHGLIHAEQGIERVFKAATEGGTFTACTKGVRAGEIDRVEHQSFARILLITIHYMIQGRRPMLYAVYKNRDSLIAAKGYKNKETGKFVSQFDASADVFDYFYAMWCEQKGFPPHDDITKAIGKLRTPRRKVLRDRLPIKIKRERL